METTPPNEFVIVFTDMEGSSNLWRELDSSFLPILERHDSVLLEAVTRHGGRPVQSTGDGFFLKFGTADEALEFAYDTLKALRTIEWREIDKRVEEIRVRIGIHLGRLEPYNLLQPDDYRGANINKAARVMDTAYGGTVVISGEAYSSLSEMTRKTMHFTSWDWHDLKGVGRVYLWQPVWDDLPSEFGPIPRTMRVMDNFVSPRVRNENFLGRDNELLRLHTQFRSGRPEAKRQLITGLGAWARRSWRLPTPRGTSRNMTKSSGAALSLGRRWRAAFSGWRIGSPTRTG